MRKEELVVGNIYVPAADITYGTGQTVSKGTELQFLGWKRSFRTQVFTDYKAASQNRMYTVDLVFSTNSKTVELNEARYLKDAFEASPTASVETDREKRKKLLEQRLSATRSRLAVVSSSVEELLAEHAKLTAMEEKLNFQINALKAYKSDDDAIAAMVAELKGEVSPDKIRDIISKFSPV